jgi:arsenate reductase (glutaredoxin)
MQVTIYFNPRCAKSRAALKLLQDKNISPKVVDYLAQPPSAAELERLLTVMGREPRALMRLDEPLYRELGLANAQLTRKQLVTALAGNPQLLQRPIVVVEDDKGARAALGRPPKKVLDIL